MIQLRGEIVGLVARHGSSDGKIRTGIVVEYSDPMYENLKSQITLPQGDYDSSDKSCPQLGDKVVITLSRDV